MEKRFKFTYLAAIMATTLVTTYVAPVSVPVYGAAVSNNASLQHQLPILQVMPADNTNGVRPDAPIQIVLDPNAPTYNRFAEQFIKGAYQLTLNGQAVQSTYNEQTHTISVAPMMLNRYTLYTVNLTMKAIMHSNDQTASGNAAYSFAFRTGSALHEATHLSAQIEQPVVPVTTGGKLDVQVTDDYGLPATNATVEVTSTSSTLQAPVLTLGTDNKGQGVVTLTDHSPETVALNVTAQDGTYHEAVDTQTLKVSEQFVPGPPDHLTLQASTPLTAGQSEHLSGIVYDLYNNPVADNTVVSVATTGGTALPQTKENTSAGTYDFVFDAPTKVQDVTVTATAGEASASSVVHIQPDQPSSVSIQPTTTNPVAGQTDDLLVTVTDQYGNPVPNATLTVAATGDATVPSTITTDANGQAHIPCSDTKAEPVNVTVTTANGINGTTTLHVQTGAPMKISAQTDNTSVPADGKSTSITVLTVVDAYGNPVPNTTISLSSQGQAQLPSTVVTDVNGQASFTLTDSTAETVSVTATTENGVNCGVNVTFEIVAPPITSQDVVVWNTVVDENGDVHVSGVVYEGGHYCPSVLLPIQVTGATWDGKTIVTDSNGNFTFTFHPTSGATVSLPMADNQPEIIITPPYGSSWTDTGVQVSSGQIIHVTSGGDLDAQVPGGTVHLGGDGVFSSGSGGSLLLRSGNTYGGVTVIRLENACDHFQLGMNLTATPNAMLADGHSTSTIQGHLVEATRDYVDQQVIAPVVGATVTLTLSNSDGSLTQTTVTTDSNGNFTTTYTAGTTPGQVTVIAQYEDVQATAPITLADYSGTTAPGNISDPVVLGNGPTPVQPGQAFKLPSIPYDANNYVPFFYWSQFPIVDPGNFNQSVVNNGRMWLNQPPYGGAGTPNGLLFFRGTFTLSNPANVTFEIPYVDDVALAYVDAQPIAYNNDINYTSGFTKNGIKLPGTSGTLALGAGEHTVILEVGNAFHPGSSNGAGINFDAKANGTVLLSTNNPAQWKSTGYVSEPPTSWYYNAGNYTISEELLNFNTLNVAQSSIWTVSVP